MNAKVMTAQRSVSKLNIGHKKTILSELCCFQHRRCWKYHAIWSWLKHKRWLFFQILPDPHQSALTVRANFI